VKVACFKDLQKLLWRRFSAVVVWTHLYLFSIIQVSEVSSASIFHPQKLRLSS